MTSSNRPHRPSDDVIAQLRSRRAANAAPSQEDIDAIQAEIDTIDQQLAEEETLLHEKLEDFVAGANMVQDEHDQAVSDLEAQRSEKQTRLDELTGNTTRTPPTRVRPNRDQSTGTQRRTGSNGRPITSPAPKKSRTQRVLDKLSRPMHAIEQTSYKTFAIIGLVVAVWVFFSFNHDDSLGDGVAYQVLPLYVVFYCGISLLIGWLLKRFIRKELDSQKARKESQNNQQS